MNYEHEVKYRELFVKLNGRAWSLLYPVDFIDTKTGQITDQVTGRAQGARCLYCRKQICAWGKLAKGRRSTPPKLKDALDHCYDCAEDWIWRTLAAFSTGLMNDTNARIVGEWKKRIRDVAERDWRLERIILAMFDKLPSPMGTDVADAIEFAFQTIHRELSTWPEWTPFQHGDDDHPHVFLKTNWDSIAENGLSSLTKRGDFEEFSNGLCQCGLIGPVGRRAVDVPTYHHLGSTR